MDGRNPTPTGGTAAAPGPLQHPAAAAAGGAILVAAASLSLLQAPAPAIVAVALFGAIALVALTAFAQMRPRPPFGAANAITLGRAGMVAVVAGYAAEPPPGEDEAWWIAAGLAGTALLLDGADGWAARRRGLATAFGARFDMEVDALAALLLSLVIWRADRTGAWIVLIGALRYLFVLAGWALQAMRRPLPPSRRRRAICALQGALLVLCLLPGLPAWGAPALGALALAATGISFLIDTIWLIRRRGPSP
ncbi:MAG: CDP-alcohol phosphatidyltransferase family protein [Alphaproteobacteria bacterium]|nr:CDP-alcohol phosphatidyltransferase family protein [Alphaproteobacteria bacterium]